MLGLTDYFAYYLSKLPFVADYFDFLRNVLFICQILLILVFLINSKKKRFIFYYLFIFILAFSLSNALKILFPSMRPITFYFALPS